MIVCVDIGGGTTRVGFSSDGKGFDDIIKFETPDVFDELMEKIIQEIKKNNTPADKIAVAAAGSVDEKEGSLIRWGQKHSWWGKSIFNPLKAEFPDAKLYLENDADMATLGEALFGSGVGYESVGLVTFSSGIGAGHVLNKKIIDFNLGSEPGHIIVDFESTEEWSCGQKGCWESFASGTAFKKRFGISPESCRDQQIWNEYAKYVAVGITSMVLLWTPQIIVIGGGVSNQFEMFREPVISELKKLLGSYDNLMPEIVRMKLDEPGLYGGLVI